MYSLRLILKNRRYFAPAWVFASLNFWFGTWAIYIPAVKDKLEIDKANLGFAIFFLSLGVFTIFPLASGIINRIGVGKATWYGVVVSSITAMIPLLATDYLQLVIGLFLFGASNGFTDISMNTLVTELEKEDKVNVMSAVHGFFSLGGVLAGLGSFLIPLINNPALHMGIVVIFVFIINTVLRRQYIHITAAPVAERSFSWKALRPLLILGLVSFVVMASEGAVVDWSALYLEEISLAPEYLLGAGFLAFSVTMTTGRFLGDAISSRIGSYKTVAYGSGLAMLGYISILIPGTLLTIVGFGLVGIGLSVVIPELFRLAGQNREVESSKAVSFIAGSGYSGFLVAPPLLGFLAEATSLRVSFASLLGATILVLAAILWLQKRRR